MGSITRMASSSIRRRAERAASLMRDGADYAADAGSSTYDRLGSLLDDLQGMLARSQKVSGREYAQLRKQMSKKLVSAGETLGAISDDARGAALRSLKRTGGAMRAHPLQTVGVAAAAGLLIGFLISRRQGS